MNTTPIIDAMPIQVYTQDIPETTAASRTETVVRRVMTATGQMIALEELAQQ